MTTAKELLEEIMNESELDDLQSLLKKGSLKGGKISGFEKDDGLGGENLIIKVLWDLGKDKAVRSRDYFVGFEKRGQYTIDFANNAHSLGTDPAAASKKILGMLKNPYTVLETGKEKGKTWWLVSRSDTHPPIQGLFGSGGGTDIYKTDRKDHAKDQLLLQMKR